MIARGLAWGVAASALLMLVACGERPQKLDSSSRKSDEQAWAVSAVAEPTFAASGWKAGDKTAWESHIRQRNQLQNDYAR